MSQDDEKLRRMVFELRVLEETVNTLQTRIGFINAAIRELQIANETINGIKNEDKGSHILVPIGGGSYINAQITDTKNLLVGIGANVSTVKNIASAQEDIGTRILELEKTKNAVQKQLEDVNVQIRRTQNQLRIMARQQNEGNMNV
ncbi:MAG: prefoldin subunit alpha [Candidatus Bathyarchaeota archaeon]|nr:MAG: prefoldin subunit alpha [Candidatus Bathyarchaeota archaeon]